MPHLRADLSTQMPHPGEDEVVKSSTNEIGGGFARLEMMEPLCISQIEGCPSPPPPPGQPPGI